MSADPDRWIGRGEALGRLGVKAQTLYAYVSRGRIAARPDPEDPRRSLYAARDIARLAGDRPADNDDAPLLPSPGAAGRGEADHEKCTEEDSRHRLHSPCRRQYSLRRRLSCY